MPKNSIDSNLFGEQETLPDVKGSKDSISIPGKTKDEQGSCWKIVAANPEMLKHKPVGGTALTQPVIETMHHFTGKISAPKLYIKGRSTLDGRLATTLRIRPSLVEDLEKVAVGPLYLLVDVAIQRLIAELMDMPKDAPSIAIAGESMDPSVYDRALLQEADRVPKKRVEFLHAQQARKAAESNDAAAGSSE